MKNSEMRIGIDLGDKIEALAIDTHGVELARHRIDTPRDDYDATIRAMVGLVHRLEQEIGRTGTVGAGIPGSISRITGLVKNANSTWLNGRPLDQDLTHALDREVRIANDANCFAVSEATDGAAAGKHIVFGVILEPDVAVVLLSARASTKDRTASLANGDIIHWRGQSLTSIRGQPATAGNVDAWRCGFPVPELLWITRLTPAERAPRERSSQSLRPAIRTQRLRSNGSKIVLHEG